MKRKAILIESSNVAGHNDLPGARVDIENWQIFLKSENGGSWKTTEIVVLRKPLSTQVEAELKVSMDTYCFVAFSGHGSEGSVVLNDVYDNFSISNLTPKGERGTMIVDSCRGFSGARHYSFSAGHRLAQGKMAAFANQSSDQIVALNAKSAETLELLENRTANTRRAYASNAFVVWGDALTKSAKGTVKMYSCSAGQAAGEDPSSGGYYTSLLLEGAEAWVSQSNYQSVYSTKNAHDYAKVKLPAQQVPEYTPVTLAFPFAAK